MKVVENGAASEHGYGWVLMETERDFFSRVLWVLDGVIPGLPDSVLRDVLSYWRLGLLAAEFPVHW